MFTIKDVSPYQVSGAMRVSRDVARDMLADDSGSTYERDVFGTRYTLDPVARTLTSEVIATPASDTVETVETGREYTFYVGSNGFYDAHTGTHAVDALPNGIRNTAHMGRELASGVWDGIRENVALYRVLLPNDETAQRIAYAMTVTTGNDAVLVSRDRVPGDYGVMASNRRFLAMLTLETNGDGMFFDAAELSSDVRSRFSPDVAGHHVAFLVNADATVSAVR